MEPKINAGELKKVFLDCLFRPDEIVDGKPITKSVTVEGIIHNYGFHVGRLQEHREQIGEWLRSLPAGFQEKTGGGWSFLNACNDCNGVQWADLHTSMENLMCLGLGLGLVTYLMPREMWDVLPGGMPYFCVKERS